MIEPNHPSYYERRAAAERAMADRARDPHIARIHLDMADRYARQAEATSSPALAFLLERT